MHTRTPIGVAAVVRCREEPQREYSRTDQLSCRDHTIIRLLLAQTQNDGTTFYPTLRYAAILQSRPQIEMFS
jgi:hypothetical protein